MFCALTAAELLVKEKRRSNHRKQQRFIKDLGVGKAPVFPQYGTQLKIADCNEDYIEGSNELLNQPWLKKSNISSFVPVIKSQESNVTLSPISLHHDNSNTQWESRESVSYHPQGVVNGPIASVILSANKKSGTNYGIILSDNVSQKTFYQNGEYNETGLSSPFLAMSEMNCNGQVLEQTCDDTYPLPLL